MTDRQLMAPGIVEKAAHPVSIQQAPPYITRTPLYIANPTLFTAKQWREVAREPVNKLCQRHILRELAALEWDITSDKPKEHEHIIKHYKRIFSQADDGDGWDVWLSRMLQDAMTLPIAGNAEVRVDEETGMLGGLWHVDGATLYPTYDRDVPFVQINPYNGLDRVYFLRGDLLRLRFHPRVDLVMKQYQEAPTESAWVGIESLSRVYIYYMKQLSDTPMVGILDVMDMTAEEAVDWAVNFREMLEGIDPLKIPLLYDHTKPAKFIPFTRSPEDLNILENFKRFAEMVASAYGLGIGDLRLFEHERVLAGVEASQRVTARSGVGFYAQAVEDMINSNILFKDQSGIEFKFKLGMTGEEQQEAQLALTRAQIVAAMAGPSTPLLKPEDAQKQLVQWKVIDVEPTGVPAAPGLEGLGGLLGGGEGAPGGGGPEGGAPGGSAEGPSIAESAQRINAVAEDMQQYKALAEQRLGGYVYKARSETVEQLRRLLAKAFQQVGRALDDKAVQAWVEALQNSGKVGELKSLLEGPEYIETDADEVAVYKATAGEELDALLDEQDWWLLPDITAQLFGILKQAYEEGSLTAIEGIQQAGYATGLTTSPTSPVTEFALRNPKVEALLQEHAAEMVQNVDDGTKFFLRNNILTGVENGWGAAEIARYVQANLFGINPGEAEQLSESRILSIVNTELNWADSRATFDQMTAVGLKTKGWVTSGHDQCDLCLRNEALGFVPLDHQYEGVFGEILHPPAHPRTCRCYLASNAEDLKQFFGDGAPYWLGGEADDKLVAAVEEETQRMIDEAEAQQKALPMNEWGQPDGYNLGKRSRFESEGDAQHWLAQFSLVPVISDSDIDVRGGNWAQAGVIWGKDSDGFVEAAVVNAENLPMADITSGKAHIFGAKGIRDSGIVAPPNLKAHTDSAMVAIEVPPDIAAALGYVGDVPHITLAYLGKLDGRFDRKAAMDAVSSVTGNSDSFTVRLTGEVEQFGPDGDKVSAAVVAFSPALKRLRDDLKAALVRFGQTADATWNEFRPHVTMGAGAARMKHLPNKHDQQTHAGGYLHATLSEAEKSIENEGFRSGTYFLKKDSSGEQMSAHFVAALEEEVSSRAKEYFETGRVGRPTNLVVYEVSLEDVKLIEDPELPNEGSYIAEEKITKDRIVNKLVYRVEWKKIMKHVDDLVGRENVSQFDFAEASGVLDELFARNEKLLTLINKAESSQKNVGIVVLHVSEEGELLGSSSKGNSILKALNGFNSELALTWHVPELVLFLGGDKSHWQFRDLWREAVPSDFTPKGEIETTRDYATGKSEAFPLWAESLPGQYRKEFADLVRARLGKEPAEATDEELLRVYRDWMETLVVGGFDYFKGTSGGTYPPLVRSMIKSTTGEWRIVGGSFSDDEHAALQAEGAVGVARWAWANGYAVVPKAFRTAELSSK